jgi:two-component system, OmpR family, manganese sensing response regulator
MAKILIVEDDVDLSTVLVDLLETENYVVEAVHDGEESMRFLDTYKYDVIVLDWLLPGISGLNICKKLRLKGIKTPIIMLTARNHTEDIIIGLDAGATDYLTKPFESKELLARLRSLLRRPEKLADSKLVANGILLDRGAHKATLNGELLELYPKEFALLEHLMRHPNKIFNKCELLDQVWSKDPSVTTTVVRATVHNLRRNLCKDGSDCPIQTVHAMGYTFVQ